jgi:hypothetical protein
MINGMNISDYYGDAYLRISCKHCLNLPHQKRERCDFCRGTGVPPIPTTELER